MRLLTSPSVLRNALGFLFFVLSPQTQCSAEYLSFVSGVQLQAPATVVGDRVRVETPAGPVWFLRRDVSKIVPGGCPEKEWAGRRSEALRHDSKARLAAAWWALENGLVPESVELLRAARAEDASNRVAERLVDVIDRLEKPCEDPDSRPLRQALGGSFETARGSHVLLLHQHHDSEARARLTLLENVVTAYYLYMTGLGIDLTVPDRRLVSVYLKNHDDYLAFLRSQNAGAFRSTLGYYHPTFHAVVAYDARSPGKLKAIVDHPSQANDGAGERAADTVRGAFAVQARVSRQESSLTADDRARRLMESFDESARDLGTAAHEMIHLLVTESGLEPRPGAFPLWLHEGLASQFEVVRGGRWAGVGRAHDLRLPDFRSCPAKPDLQDLVQGQGFGRGYRRDVYAKSWSLVYYLRKTRPKDFLKYLDLLRLHYGSGAITDGSRFESTFEAAFDSDLASLDAEWLTFMRGLRTPLEEALSPTARTDAR